MRGTKEGQCVPTRMPHVPWGWKVGARGALSWRQGCESPRAGLREGHSLPTVPLPAGSRRRWRGREGPGGQRGGKAASEALVHAQGTAGDVLQLPRHVVSHADVVVCQHLQHQP